jgi:ATP synthase protein I
MQRGIRNILIAQVVLVLTGFTVGIVQYGKPVAVALMFGGLMTVINTLLLARCMTRAEKIASKDPGKNLKLIYLCAAQRLLMTVVLFGVGIGLLKMKPLPLLLGFMLGQVAHFLNGVKNRV